MAENSLERISFKMFLGLNHSGKLSWQRVAVQQPLAFNQVYCLTAVQRVYHDPISDHMVILCFSDRRDPSMDKFDSISRFLGDGSNSLLYCCQRYA